MFEFWPRNQEAVVGQSYQEMVELFQTGDPAVKVTYFQPPRIDTPHRVDERRVEISGNGDLLYPAVIEQSVASVKRGYVVSYEKKRISTPTPYGSREQIADRFETWFSVNEDHWEEHGYRDREWTTRIFVVYDHERNSWHAVLDGEELRRASGGK